MALLPLVLVIVGHWVQADASLPPGVHGEWGLQNAWRETTPTRERICLNGLWRWQPGGDSIPESGWGWFKVPGPWPGITDYLEKDCQTVYPNPSWARADLGRVTSAWYRRTFTVPGGWVGRRITLSASYVDSLATVYVDGKLAGSIPFPTGDVDLTRLVKPGETHLLSIQVVALPLKGVMLSYSDTNSAKSMKATVDRRGLCGDVYLVSTPRKARIDDLRVDTSVRNGSITVRAWTSGLDPERRYRLRAQILDDGKPVSTIASDPFSGRDTRGSLGGDASAAVRFTSPWKSAKLWDLDTPQNQYDLQLTLLDDKGKVLDVQAPRRFGFREFWIKGRDFILNGTRVFWCCVTLENASISAALASYEGAKETLRRLKGDGINMVYTGNYDCNPGSNLAFDEILQAADDVGMLVALTQPHFGDYDWNAPDADEHNGYVRHAAFLAQIAGSHPSVVAYSTSHNATGYNGDTNPDEIDGIHADRDGWAQNNMAKALRAQAIIEKLDPSRIIYHHSSGNLGTMHTVNFYLNFVPMQELDDWFEHWATDGVKPVFMVEYGVPFSWDWSLYRGWHRGQRSFGNAEVPWEYTMAEWNAQFLGDRAYDVSQAEKRNVRWEANKFRSRSPGWFRWDYPYPMGSPDTVFEDQQLVWAQYTADNWRAFRTWGVSGISPWETYGTFWQLEDGVDKGRVQLKTDWGRLQRPGYSPDYVEGRFERRDVAYDASDWVPTAGGKSLIANNGPLLAYIGGKPNACTDKEHIFRPGESIQKQIVIVNNSRRTVRYTCTWSVDSKPTDLHSFTSTIATGEIQKTPFSFTVAASTPPGVHGIGAKVKFSTGEVQADRFRYGVLPPTPKLAALGRVGLFDPAGETTKLLAALGVKGAAEAPGADLSAVDTLIVGKNALTPDGPGLDLSRVRSGLKVIVFEQSSETLEKRFGFRVEEYGLRNVFRRVPGHPILDGLDEELLRDWRGAATLFPPRGKFVMAEQFNGAPSVVRTGILQPRVWRCGNRGSVASVLIEKPAVGDFTPILDGGYSLQYSPLLEYREGEGVVILCQMDVTGRTAEDPAAERLVVNLLNYVAAWRPSLPGSQHAFPLRVGERGRGIAIKINAQRAPTAPLLRGAFGAPAPKGVWFRFDAPHMPRCVPFFTILTGMGGRGTEVLSPRQLPPRGRIEPDVNDVGLERTLVYVGDEAGKAHLERAGFTLAPYHAPLDHDEILVAGPGAPSIAADIGPWLQKGGHAIAVGLDREAMQASLGVSVPTRTSEYIGSVFPPAPPGSPLAGVGPGDVYNRDPREIPVLGASGGVLGTALDGRFVQFQLAPWSFDPGQINTKRVFRHASFALSRLLGNLGAHASTPFLSRFASPAQAGERRWLQGFYLDTPALEDDPYRFFGW